MANDHLTTQEKNEALFYTLLRQVRPDLFVLTDLIDKNGMNVYVLFRVMRQLINVAQGSRWGKVMIFINNNKVTQIEGVDTDKVNEEIFSQTQEGQNS